MDTCRGLAIVLVCAVLLAWQGGAPTQAQTDPLPSWNDGAVTQSIVDFVTRVTKEGGLDFVAPPERVATFDNDGTLWIEQPLYNQFVFAIDEVKKQANQHPGSADHLEQSTLNCVRPANAPDYAESIVVYPSRKTARGSKC